jgi:nicotinate phosphoribosyltransferase
LTDLYQLTMAQSYFQLGMQDTAVFELFVRRLPATRNFLIAAGLEQAIESLQTLRFSAEEIGFLQGLGVFSAPFLERLATLRFTGTVHAMPEGTPLFADEPILRITAPLPEAQIVESRLVNVIHFQTLIASKAARCVLAAGGRRLVDFGMRRAHEADAAVLASRASYLAGFHATATVESARRFGIPASGTMAHSFIEAHDHEEQAFRNFVMSQAGTTTLLIDTYDSERAAHRVAKLVRELREAGAPQRVGAVRIDSGDLASQARSVRAILDAHGCGDVQIVLSGGLDEYRVGELVDGGIPVDAFGIGTALDVSADAPALDIAYKLQEYAGRPRRKLSPGKATWPGAKQVFRERDAQGSPTGDTIALASEPPAGEPLLARVMCDGRRIARAVSLGDTRDYCLRELNRLPAALRKLQTAAVRYPVRISEQLVRLAAQVDESLH